MGDYINLIGGWTDRQKKITMSKSTLKAEQDGWKQSKPSNTSITMFACDLVSYAY